MATVNLRFRACFKGAKLTDKEVASIVNMADQYGTDDVQANYVAAISDTLNYLKDVRKRVENAVEGKPSPKGEAAVAATPVAAVEVTEDRASQAWFNFAPEDAPNYKLLSPELKAEWKAAVTAGEGRRAAARSITAKHKEAASAAAGELWSDMMDDGSPEFAPFEALSTEAQERWAAAVARNKATGELGERILRAHNASAEWDAVMNDGTSKFVTFANLNPEDQERWTKALMEGRANIELGEVLMARSEKAYSAAEDLQEAMDEAKSAKSVKVFGLAISDVMQMAFFNTDSNNLKNGLVKVALKFLEELQVTQDQHERATLEFVTLIKDLKSLQYAPGKGERKGEVNAWFTYADKNNLLSAITRAKPDLKITNMPEAVIKAKLASGDIQLSNLPEETAKEFRDAPSKPAPTSTTITNTPEFKLQNLINGLWGEDQILFTDKRKINALLKRMRALYESVSEDMQDYLVRGQPLRDYFDADGNPKGRRSAANTFVVTTEEVSDTDVMVEADRVKAALEEARRLAAEARKEEASAERSRSGSPYDDKNGAFLRDDGTPLGTTVPVGRIRMVIASLMSRFYKRPTVHVFANVADMRTKDNALYRRAKAEYKGDFDAVASKAMGYAFGGDTVIVFSDFIRTEQQLRFLMAHEVLGHFGFAGIMPKRELDAALEEVYRTDPAAKAVVDAMVEVEKIPRLEAIEEYLASNAATMETSVLYRFWTQLKNVLNKLGFTFKDDMARYLVGQARKYVRTGKGGFEFSGASLSSGYAATEGRFQRATPSTFSEAVSNSFASMGYTQAMSQGPNGGIFNFADAWKKVADRRQDVPGTVSRALNAIQTLDNKARRSYGLSLIYNMLEKQQQFARRLLAKYERMTGVTHEFSTTDQDKLKAGWYLSHAALLRSRAATDEVIRKQQSIVQLSPDGSLTLNRKAIDALKTFGVVTAEEFRKGFKVTYDDGKGGVTEQLVQDNVDENSTAWKIYLEQRNTVAEAAVDMMLANFEAAQDESTRIFNDLNYKRTGLDMFTAEDLEAIKDVSRRYIEIMYAGSTIQNASKELRKESRDKAERLVIAVGRALFNDDVMAVWLKRPDAKPEILADLAEFQNSEYDDIRKQLPSLAAKVQTDKKSFVVQKAIRDQFMFDLQAQNAEYYAMRTIMGAYVPFTRRGDQQVKLTATDMQGRYVTLHESAKTILPYYQFDSRREALEMQADLNNTFGGEKTWKLMVDDGTGEGKEMEVRLTAEVSRVRQSPDLVEAVNFNEFIYALNRMNINIKPDERERIVKTLTDTNARARKNLFRSGTPGWDKDVIRSVSEYLESTAHVAAKKRFRHRMDDIFLRQENWLGDDAKLAALKAAVDNATTDEQRAEARREYAKYAYMYQYMKPEAQGRTVEVGGKQTPTLGRGEDYREEAKSILRWYTDAGNIIESTEDKLSGEVGSQFKMWVVVAQLGGSVATALVNFTSLMTHSIPYLATHNEKMGFGGGFSVNKASNAIWKAATDLKNYNLSDGGFISKVVESGKWADYGMTEDEARFLLAATEEGVLQAALFNALIGSARGQGTRNNKMQAAIQTWMGMFSYTEQMNRRVTAMAAYRLEKERALAMGMSEADASAKAAQFARDAVNDSQGEYGMFNRPEMARGNLMQYVFMYKQFSIITVQLLRNMPFKGRALMIGFLLLASGMRGLPFAEDLMDILDTIMQKLGLTTASVEKELMEFFDGVAPGMTPAIMKGVLDQFTGVTISSRLGMGDLIPLTGALRAGASPTQELKDFAGPAVGGLIDATATAGNIARYSAEVIGLRDDTTSVVDILRKSPVAAFRSIADGSMYLADGRVTNKDGQVVSSDAGVGLAMARMLGFYPAEATLQNDVVRLSKQLDAYAKEIKADYVQAYRKAYLDSDQAGMKRIREYVREWNADAQGTGLEISGFEKSALRSAREMSRPTLARYLKSAPEGIKPETVEMLQAMGYDVEDL